MVVDLLATLNLYGNSVVEAIRQNLSSTGTNATGKTSKSLRYEVKENGSVITLKVLGKPYFTVVETGRKPTPEFTKPSYQFVASIKEWVRAKGLPEGSAYAIAKSIHQKGTKLYNASRDNIFSNVINYDLTSKISKDVLEEFASEFLINIKSLYGRQSN